MHTLMTIISAILFASGLIISGMVRPDKVIGFLDVTGRWDPTLAFVMGGALLINTPLWHLIKRRPQPLCDSRFHLPSKQQITPGLILGSALFGLGWALGGFCPGPALVSLGTTSAEPVTVVAGLIIGMLIVQLTQR